MKVETFYKNVGKVLDECLEKNPDALLYENADEGVYFAKDSNKAYYAYFLPNHCVVSAVGVKMPITNKLLSSACKATAYLADKSKIQYGINTETGKKVVRVCNDNGTVSFFNKTYLNKFPDNADYYLKGNFEPMVVGIWDKHDVRLHICGCVCPIHMTDNVFIAD